MANRLLESEIKQIQNYYTNKGLTVNEICKIMNVSRQTVYSHLPADKKNRHGQKKKQEEKRKKPALNDFTTCGIIIPDNYEARYSYIREELDDSWLYPFQREHNLYYKNKTDEFTLKSRQIGWTYRQAWACIN